MNQAVWLTELAKVLNSQLGLGRAKLMELAEGLICPLELDRVSVAELAMVPVSQLE